MRVFILEQQSGIAKLINILGEKGFPSLVNSIKMAANEVMREWINQVKNSNTKSGFKRRYIESINLDRENKPLEASVSAKGKFVNFVETGIKRFDMKPGLTQGPHSRVSNKGIRYNIIFMRKGTPGAQHISNMSREMYTTVKKLDKEDIKRRFRTIGIGNKVDFESGSYSRKIYSSKYGRYENKGKKDVYGGMVKAGSPRHTQYGVFRVVSENSQGWIYPGIPASPVFSRMSMKMIPIVKSMMQDGLTKDLQTGLEYFNK